MQRNVEPSYHTFTPTKPEPTIAERNAAICGWALSAAGYKNRASADQLRSADKLGYDIHSNVIESMPDQTRAQSTTTTEGGDLISGSAFRGLSEKLKFFGGLRQFVNVENSPTGRPFHWAVTDNTGRQAAPHTENTSDMANTSVAFTKVTLGSFTQTSAIFPVSVEVLSDSEISLEALLSRILLTSVGRRQNLLGTTGAGTTEPSGLILNCSAGVTANSATAITITELNNLFYSVDPSYRDDPGAAWVMSDATYNKLEQQLVDENLRSLLWSSLNSLADPSKLTIKGKRVIINNDMPTMAASHKCIIFGSGTLGYLWRDVGQPVVQVYRERYADQLAVGFQVYARMDGAQIDTTAYKCITMASGGS